MTKIYHPGNYDEGKRIKKTVNLNNDNKEGGKTPCKRTSIGSNEIRLEGKSNPEQARNRRQITMGILSTGKITNRNQRNNKYTERK